jgi:hypothetical protein
MNKWLKRIAISLIGILIISGLYSQGYKHKLTQDEISFWYKWKNEKFLKLNSPKVLKLEIENLRDTRVAIQFEIIYYWEGTLHSRSDTLQYCLKPRQTIRGRRWNLIFKSDFFGNGRYLDKMFEWKITSLKVDENAKCETGMQLMLEPQYP